jgi:hypothetical protein
MGSIADPSYVPMMFAPSACLGGRVQIQAVEQNDGYEQTETESHISS